MKVVYKIIKGLIILMAFFAAIYSCSSSKETYTDIEDNTEELKMEKSGAQLWGETCNRCHLAPSPADFNDIDWETISLHMKIRANIPEEQMNKIKEFLKSAN